MGHIFTWQVKIWRSAPRRRRWRKCSFCFDETGLSHYGGLALLLEFCKYAGLKRFLSRQVRWGYMGRQWSGAELFLAHLLLAAAGVGRLENSRALRYNGALAELMGTEKFPTPRVLRAFLLGIAERTRADLEAAHDLLRRRLFNEGPVRYGAVLDLDPTALRVFGRPEGAVRGYVPRDPGRRCYRARLLTEANSGLTVRGELRPGNLLGSVEAPGFVASGLPLLPGRLPRERIRLRADAGFYDRELLEPLGNRGISYVVDAKFTAPVKRIVAGLRYREFRRGYEAAQTSYRPARWKEDTRLVVVRRLVRLLEPPVTLFILKDEAGTVQVTNLTITPQAVWRFYCDRAGQELLIRELKNAYALGKIPPRSFRANRFYLEMLLWTWDVVGWFRRRCLPKSWQKSRLLTLRRDLWNVPGHFVHTARRYTMHLPEHYAHPEVVRHIEPKVAHLTPLAMT